MGRNEPACTASGVRLVIRAYIMTCSVCRRRTAPTEPAANYGRVGVRLSPGLRAVDRAPEWSSARMAEADRGPAVPGRPADHLPGVQAGGLLAELVILFTAEVPVAVAVGRAGNEQLHLPSVGGAVSRVCPATSQKVRTLPVAANRVRPLTSRPPRRPRTGPYPKGYARGRSGQAGDVGAGRRST